MIHQN